MAKKEWYVVRAPNQFKERNVCRTLVSRTSGLKIASDGLKGRVFDHLLSLSLLVDLLLRLAYTEVRIGLSIKRNGSDEFLK